MEWTNNMYVVQVRNFARLMQRSLARAQLRTNPWVSDPLHPCQISYGSEPERRSLLSSLTTCLLEEDKEDDKEGEGEGEGEGEREETRTRSALLRGDFFHHLNTLLEGQVAHHHIVKHGLEKDKFLCGILIRMYNGLGAFDHALALFNCVTHDHLQIWNSFIHVYVSRGMHMESFQMFAQMHEQSLFANKFTFIQIVSLCGRYGFVDQGKRIHVCIFNTEYEMDVALATSLICMYGKCERFKEANQKLYDLDTCNEVPWTALISCYAQKKRFKEAMDLFVEMLNKGGRPNKVTFICILDVFTDRSGINCGRLIHVCIVESGYETDAKVEVALLSMYNRCGSLYDAQDVCDKTMEKTLILWNAMICVYVSHHEQEKAFQCFNQLEQEGYMPNKTTFICILDAFIDNKEGQNQGKRMHSYIMERGYDSDIKAGTALINMYGRCGVLEGISKAYSRLSNWDVVLFTSMIAAYCEHGQFREAIRFFAQMLQQSIEPNQVTFVCILDAYSNYTSSTDCKHMHSFIVENGHGMNVIVGNALISMYGKLGCLHEAFNMFENLSERTIVSWTAMISIEAQKGQFQVALQLFNQMQENGVLPNVVTFISILDACAIEAAIEVGRLIHMCALESGLEPDDAVVHALVNMYGKCGSLEDSKTMFACISEGSEPVWTSMITVHAQQGEYEQMLELFDKMEKNGLKPTVMTYISLLDACSNYAVSLDGEYIHSSLITSGCDDDANISTALMNMYGRCGNVNAAQRTFERISDPNVVSWTSMITLYGQHGKGSDAWMIFQKMQHIGIIPNKVTYTTILDACNHDGMVFEAINCLAQIIHDDANLLDVDHYICIIDLLGRVGCLDDAMCLIGNMPFQPNVIILTAILGACKCHNNVQEAVYIAKFILELDPDNVATFVMLSNIYISSFV